MDEIVWQWQQLQTDDITYSWDLKMIELSAIKLHHTNIIWQRCQTILIEK